MSFSLTARKKVKLTTAGLAQTVWQSRARVALKPGVGAGRPLLLGVVEIAGIGQVWVGNLEVEANQALEAVLLERIHPQRTPREDLRGEGRSR